MVQHSGGGRPGAGLEASAYLRAAELGACEIDSAGRLSGCDLCWRILGLKEQARPSVDDLLRVVIEDDRAKVSAAIRAALDNGGRLETVFRLGEQRHSRIVALRGSRSEVDGRPRLLFVIADVTDLRRMQNHARRSETREMIVRELGHRLRNLFPVILAMVKLTAHSQSSVSDYRTALERRLRAMAAAERLLTRGASESASIEELVRTEIAPFDGDERHAIVIQGPPLRLTGGTAQSFAMIVHELATNAVKHGALSVPDGRLEALWRLEDPAPNEATGQPTLVFEWTERNAPAPRRPLRNGFGSMVLGESGTSLLGGRAERTFTDDGLRYVLRTPFEAGADTAG